MSGSWSNTYSYEDIKKLLVEARPSSFGLLLYGKFGPE